MSGNEDTIEGQGEGYLASISPDATLRLHSTVPPRQQGQKGNPDGGKAKVVGIAGGVGMGSFALMGYGRLPDTFEVSGSASRRVRPGRKSGGSEDDEEDGSDNEDEDGEDVWNGLDAVQADDDDEEEKEEEEEEEDKDDTDDE